jgi:hypothetical protein
MPSQPTGERAPQVGSLSTDTALHALHAEDCGRGSACMLLPLLAAVRHRREVFQNERLGTK